MKVVTIAVGKEGDLTHFSYLDEIGDMESAICKFVQDIGGWTDKEIEDGKLNINPVSNYFIFEHKDKMIIHGSYTVSKLLV